MDKKRTLIKRFVLAENKIDGVYYLFSKKFGINENELTFIYALNLDDRPRSQKDISEEWLIPKTTINSIVKKLLNMGIISFVPSDNSKTKLLILTPKGKEYADKLLNNIYLAEKRAITKTLKEFSPEFIEAMEKFSKYLYEEYEGNEKNNAIGQVKTCVKRFKV